MSINPILHVVQHLQPGGIETLVLELLRLDDRVQVVSLEGTRHAAIAAWPRLKDYSQRLHFLGKGPGFSLKTVMRLVRVIDHLKPSVVHTHHVGPLIYGGLAARLSGGCRLVHTEHDAWHLENRRRALIMKVASRALGPRLISDARAVAEQVSMRLGRQSVVISNGIDVQKFSPSCKLTARKNLGISEEAVLIGTAGRLEPVKNQALLIKAFAGLGSLPGLQLAIAGTGSERVALENLAKELGLGDRIQFFGLIEDMPEFLNSLDLFVLSSDREGFPLSLIEAQACDIPVVATDVGGVREAVCPASGHLVPTGDVAALGHAISVALKSPSPGKPRGFAEREGSLATMLRRYMDVYGLAEGAS